MLSREEKWIDFVEKYDIEVPEDKIQNELNYLELEFKQNIQYDQLTGGGVHFFPQKEFEEYEEEMKKAAFFEAKQMVVLKDIILKQNIVATKEELQQKAEDICRKQNTTMEMITRFFGEDYSMLERDIKEEKAKEWAISQFGGDN